jgi:lysophospholipid acyltransferase (LPLAT)-like uncharacterized protein
MQITAWNRIQGLGLSTYAALVWRTSRYHGVGVEHLDTALASGRPTIFATWHGMTMAGFGFLPRHRADDFQLVAIVPDDHRGAVLSTWLRRTGVEPFVISMEAESMVAARRLLALIRKLTREGKALGLNPDGPDGPSHVPKDGVFFVAQKSNALVIPSAAYTGTCFHIPRWDRYIVPFPFSRITMAFGEPFEIPPGELTDAVRDDLRDRLTATEQAAERIHRQGEAA